MTLSIPTSLTCLGCFLMMTASSLGQIRLDLPTENDAIFSGNPEKFYMYVTRDFEGKKSTPWEGGQYGYVRTPVRVGGDVVYRRFHEGIDIRPTRRSSSGEPLDKVHPVAPGRVVHVSDNPRLSNYGRYVVVEHRWDGSDYYSLYAHLGSTEVKVGDRVDHSDVLGQMGYTGRGINRTRAHLHLEVGMLINGDYDTYFEKIMPNATNHHGIYNGMNIKALDVSRMLKESKQGGIQSIPHFIAKEKPFYSVLIPNRGTPDLVKRYPWLTRGQRLSGAPSLEIVFTQSSIPIAVQPSERRVSEPTIGSIRRSSTPYSYLTSRKVGGSGEKPVLSSSGEAFVNQITYSK